MTCIVAAFIIIATAAMFYYHPGGAIPVDSAAEAAAAHGRRHDHAQSPTGPMGAGAVCHRPVRRRPAGRLCISLSTSWAVGEVCGWAHSLNKSVREAPWFYVVYLGMLISAGLAVLLTTEPVQNSITQFVQVVAVTLLPAALTFLILLLNDKQLMGEYVNTRWENIANWAIVLFVIVDFHGLRSFRPFRLRGSQRCRHVHAVQSIRESSVRLAAAGKDFRFHYFSQLVGRPVCQGNINHRLGKLTDIVFRLSEPYPEAVGLYLEHGWGKPTEFIPFSRLIKIDDDAIFVQPPESGDKYPPFVDQAGWLMLDEHLMGKTILDMDGRRTEVVNDIHLLESKGRMVLVHVDISFNGFLRRWGLGRLHLLKDVLHFLEVRATALAGRRDGHGPRFAQRHASADPRAAQRGPGRRPGGTSRRGAAGRLLGVGFGEGGRDAHGGRTAGPAADHLEPAGRAGPDDPGRDVGAAIGRLVLGLAARRQDAAPAAAPARPGPADRGHSLAARGDGPRLDVVAVRDGRQGRQRAADDPAAPQLPTTTTT